MRGWLRAGLGIGLACLAGALAAAEPFPWSWAFPPGVLPVSPDATTPRHVPGSKLSFTDAQTQSILRATDWFPDSHPPMPTPVAVGRPGVFACAACHQPDGNGRPENSALAGLSTAYMIEQLHHFADGTRHSAAGNNKGSLTMIGVAKGLTPEEIDAASHYFAPLPFRSRSRIVEADTIPRVEAIAFTYRRIGDGADALGERIIEVPDDFARHELRDPNERFTAYVPRGSVAAGKALAASGGPAAQPCHVCHGEGLRGGIAPPLAGRSPSMLFRQLAAFKTGARANPEAAPMRMIANPLDTGQMIALAAYAGTLKPKR